MFEAVGDIVSPSRSFFAGCRLHNVAQSDADAPEGTDPVMRDGALPDPSPDRSHRDDTLKTYGP